MKITDLRVYVVEVHPRRPWVFVELDTDAGITGLGECTDYAATAHIVNGLETMRQAVVGADAGRIEDLWQRIFHGYSNMNGRGYVSKLISAIDVALWDIKGKSLGVPVYQLLGGRVRDRVPLYTHTPGAEGGAMGRSNVTVELSARIAREAVDAGYAAIKTDPFARGWAGARPTGGDIVEHLTPSLVADAADWMTALRDAVGPDIELLVDAHARFDVASAIRACRALEPVKLTWIEEPVPVEDTGALRQVRENTEIPLCVGERHFTRWDYLPLFEHGLVDYVMPDLAWTGGISETRRIASLAESYYVRVSPHDVQGPATFMASAQVSIASPNLYRQECVHEFFPLYDRIVKRPLDIREGAVWLDPGAPGIGVELDHGKLSPYLRSPADGRAGSGSAYSAKALAAGGGVAE